MSTLPGDVRAKLSSIAAQAEVNAATHLDPQRRLQEAARAKPARPPRPAKSLSLEESTRRLDEFLDEARAGMPDDALARAAGVSRTSVLEWRKLRGVARKKGHARRREMEVWAADAFGDGYAPDVHAVDSELRGQWDLPEFLLRQPLRYDLLSRMVHQLVVLGGATCDSIARAFGLRVRDVELALEVENAHLARVSASCVVCGRAVDPAYGQTCSTLCQERHHAK